MWGRRWIREVILEIDFQENKRFTYNLNSFPSRLSLRITSLEYVLLIEALAVIQEGGTCQSISSTGYQDIRRHSSFHPKPQRDPYCTRNRSCIGSYFSTSLNVGP